jgi:hypothetical protein
MTNSLQDRIVASRAAGEAVLSGLRREAAQIGLELPTPAWDSGLFSLQRDAYSGEEILVARWRGDPRNGMIDLRADGRVYAEFDLLELHPKRPGWFVEAIIGWGEPAALKCEARLLEMPP